ncbi:hypothetical protein Tco_0620172, partial [Tanacetum coccineum]
YSRIVKALDSVIFNSSFTSSASFWEFNNEPYDDRRDKESEIGEGTDHMSSGGKQIQANFDSLRTTIGIRARQRSSGKNKRKEIGNDSGNRSKKIKGNDSGNRSKNIDRQRFRESPLCTANRRRKKITGNDSGNHSKRTEDNDSGNRSRKRSQRFRESFPEEDTNDSGFSFQEKGRPEFALIACRRKKKEAEAFYLGIEKRKQFYHSGTKGYPEKPN